MSLESELARRAARGLKPTTVAEMKRQLKAIGYRFDPDLKADCLCRIMSGDGADESYPCSTLYVREIDTGMCAFHYQARRDKAFMRLQEMRRNEELFAVVRGRIVGF